MSKLSKSQPSAGDRPTVSDGSVPATMGSCDSAIHESASLSTTETPPQRMGHLAFKFCGRTLPLVVIKLSTLEPYFIGTWADREGLVSRESEDCFLTKEAAEQALASGNWLQRVEP